MKVILSIKPEFANKIFDGSKKFEFRKSIFKKANITTVIVYASSPIQKVIGEFEIKQVLHENIEKLWELTADYSGISKEYFLDYFNNKNEGYAIEISHVKQYDSPKNLKEDFDLLPPQSFAYLKS